MRLMPKCKLENLVKDSFDSNLKQSLFVLVKDKSVKFIVIDEIVNNVNELDFDYDNYLSCNLEIELFHKNKISKRELINRLYFNINTFIFNLMIEENPSFTEKMFPYQTVVDMVDAIAKKPDTNSIGFILKDTELDGFLTNSLSPESDLSKDHDYIITFTYEVKKYKENLISKEQLCEFLRQKVGLFVFQNLILIPDLIKE